MAREPRIAAHLGRPETPEEEAARKAENSRRYRQSQSFRNLIVALAVSLAVVAVIYFGVPRGEMPDRPEVDVPGLAERASEQLDRPIVVPEGLDDWGVNVAELSGGAPSVWTIAYNEIPGSSRSFLRVEQAMDADEVWASQVLSGARPSGSLDVDGVEWTVYELGDGAGSGNVTYALGTQAGPDHLLVYGHADADDAEAVARALSGQIPVLEEKEQ
ncbi:DUF4245 family protein [Microbacterium sp. gxy059]|uniref:DUF4245 family protein n=1 Tax=Microbacterium sp. gxy059 TaxID=2957199 RepID=UPI003D97E8AB